MMQHSFNPGAEAAAPRLKDIGSSRRSCQPLSNISLNYFCSAPSIHVRIIFCEHFTNWFITFSCSIRTLFHDLERFVAFFVTKCSEYLLPFITIPVVRFVSLHIFHLLDILYIWKLTVVQVSFCVALSPQMSSFVLFSQYFISSYHHYDTCG